MTRIPVGFQPVRSQNFSFLNPVHGLQKTDWWFVLIYDTAATSRATFLRGTCERYFWISRGNLDRICWKREFYVWFRNYETARTCASRNNVKNTFCRGVWYSYFLPPPSLPPSFSISLLLAPFLLWNKPLDLKDITPVKARHGNPLGAAFCALRVPPRILLSDLQTFKDATMQTGVRHWCKESLFATLRSIA